MVLKFAVHGWGKIKAGAMMYKGIQSCDANNLSDGSIRQFQSYLHLISLSPGHKYCSGPVDFSGGFLENTCLFLWKLQCSAIT